MTPPDFERDLVERICQLMPATWKCKGADQNAWPGIEPQEGPHTSAAVLSVLVTSDNVDLFSDTMVARPELDVLIRQHQSASPRQVRELLSSSWRVLLALGLPGSNAWTSSCGDHYSAAISTTTPTQMPIGYCLFKVRLLWEVKL